VTAHYAGYGAMSGKMFDSSWTSGSPVEFPLSNVITGWQEGLLGMKVGGRRVLVIPASMGYGTAPPQGSGIMPNENLVFVVDLTAVK
jgi:peptidylprolyl isomerase